MNIEDLDLEQEWNKFKQIIKDRPFTYDVFAAYYYENDDDDSIMMSYKLNHRIFEA